MKTLDYGKFKFLTQNRDIHQSKVDNIAESIKEIGFLESRAILIDRNWFVIDGQHRFTSAKSLGLTIYFIITNYGLKETQIFNTNSKNWKKEDYLDGYCKAGNSNYLTFRSFMN